MSPKISIFSEKKWMRSKDNLLSIQDPLVMGILNVTPDSFYDGGKHQSVDTALNHAASMIEQGVDIIDIGGYSSRPGADNIDENEEMERVIPIVEAVAQEFPECVISIDSFRANVAKACVQAGANIVNDISGGELDSNMFQTVAELQVPYILMHMKGAPQNMQTDPTYGNVVDEVMTFFTEKVNQLHQLGVNDVILDPGFGFGKTLDHNYTLLKHLNAFKAFGLPVLIGVSRKSMVNKVIKTKPEDALNGSTVLHTISLLNGAKIIRTHDVRAAKEAVKIVNKYAHS